MCFRLQIDSRWMMKTHWRAQSQRSHSGGPTPRTKQEDWTPDRSHYTNEYTEALHSSTTWVRRNAVRTAGHNSGQSPVTYSVIQGMYTCTEAAVLSTRLTSCKPYDIRKRTCPKLTFSLSQLSLHSILLSSFVLFMFLYCADILCKCNTYIVATITLFTRATINSLDAWLLLLL